MSLLPPHAHHIRPMNGARILQAGQIAPDFALQDSTGAMRRLSQLVAERALILVFYRGYW